jgi:hypothetical protein
VTAPEFSICTLVSDRAQYAAMRESFAAGGFGAPGTEYLHLDNSEGNRWEAYGGIRDLLGRARGRHVILCHQDVRLLDEGAAALQARLNELDARDAGWAIAGNAGATAEGRFVLRITDPHAPDARRGPLPAAVVSLDENFLVLRNSAGLRPSAELAGFHLYGTDLCLQARMAGRGAWVVDFHLRHLSAGRVDAAFLDQQAAFERHWGARLGRTERLRTTCTRLTLAAGPFGRLLATWRLRRLRRRLGR